MPAPGDGVCLWGCVYETVTSVSVCGLHVSNIFGARAVFSKDICCIFPQCMQVVSRLIEGMTALVTTACRGYRERLPLCSVIVTVLAGAGLTPQLLVYKAPDSLLSCTVR